MAFQVPEKFRFYKPGHHFSSDVSDGNNGLFFVKVKHGQVLQVVASDQIGWEHVSVSRKDRCPTWEEMCQVKDLFWGEDDCVIQYHPPKSEYINNHPYCLHLWRPIDVELPRPHKLLVGV